MKNVDISKGLERIRAISAQLEQDMLKTTAGFEEAQGFDQRPWLIAGCSDGIGLQTAIAAIDAGILKFGVGVYWEPPHFTELGEDGKPVSPVHYARIQNAHALAAYAAEHGARLDIVEANVILTPRRTLKGEVKDGETAAPLPQEVVEAFEAVRKVAPQSDSVFVNSVAFGKWISPREGEEAIAVPTIDFEGRIVEMTTKKYHARGYQETLDTMGRNHLVLMEAVVAQGWLGPNSLTAFFTWAGGSQNVASLRGIYGFGALGDAKLIAERDVAAFRINHPVEEYGAHAIVRLPAFLSAALMGIPGGGLFGLISQQILESHDCFDNMPMLASKMVRQMFGPEWVRENPISQIELDHAECLYIEEINEAVEESHRRIAAHRASLSAEELAQPLPIAVSEQLLEGLAPVAYRALLRKFTPSVDDAHKFSVTADFETFRFGVAKLLKGSPFEGREIQFEEIELTREIAGPVKLTFTAGTGEQVLLSLADEAGIEVGRGMLRFGSKEIAYELNHLGQAVSRTTLGAATLAELTAPLMHLGRRVQIEHGKAASAGDELLAYKQNGVLTWLNTDANPVLRVTVS